MRNAQERWVDQKTWWNTYVVNYSGLQKYLDTYLRLNYLEVWTQEKC